MSALSGIDIALWDLKGNCERGIDCSFHLLTPMKPRQKTRRSYIPAFRRKSEAQAQGICLDWRRSPK